MEFGLCKQEGQLRAYGAGLLSSISELKVKEKTYSHLITQMCASVYMQWLHHLFYVSVLQHALSGNARIMPFDPKVTSKQECIITTFQDVYFVSDSFEEAKVKMR